MSKEILRMRDVCAGLHTPQGLDCFQFHISEAECVAVMGLADSGKKTIYDYLKGHIPLRSGRVVFEGKECPTGEKFPYTNRVVCIGDQSTLVPGLSVAENIFIINGKKRGYQLAWRPNIDYRAKLLLGKYAPFLSPRSLVRDLTPIQKRIVELLRAIESEASLVLIDDIFSDLGQEDEHLMIQCIQTLIAENISVIMECHRIERMSDLYKRVVIINKGKNMRTFFPEDYNNQMAISLMVNNEVSRIEKTNHPNYDKKSFTIEGLTKESLDFFEGEIIGLYDINSVRNVQLMRQFLGLSINPQIRMKLYGKAFEPKSIGQSMQKGVRFIPQSLEKWQLFDTMNYMDNLSIPMMNKAGNYKWFRARKLAKFAKKEYKNRLGLDKLADKQQMFEFDDYTRAYIFLEQCKIAGPKLLVCNEPWANADLTIQNMLFQMTMNAADHGSTVFVVSQNLERLRTVCDRLLVMNEKDDNVKVFDVEV